MHKLKLVGVGACLFAGACASTPDMQVGYFLPQVSTQFKAVESLGCDPENHIIGSVTGTITSKYSADRSRQVPIQLKNLDGQFSDSDLSFDFHDDGRLKGLNAESTGQGQAIVKAAAAIFSNLIMAMDGAVIPTAPEDCANIAKWGGDKKVLTLTFVGDTDFPEPANKDVEAPPFVLLPETNSFFYANALKKIGSVCAKVGSARASVPTADPVAGTTDKSLRLELRQPAISVVQIRKYAGPNCTGNVLRTVTTEEVQVPQRGTRHYILLPKAAAFGKQSTVLTLSDAGTITKLKYGKTSGAASALNAFGAAAGAVDETRAEQIARLKEEADLIVAQERLVRCLASKEDCK